MCVCVFLVCVSGVRKFMSSSASRSFQYIGGPAVILSLVAMATDDSSLYAAVKVCVSVLTTNGCMEREMRRMQGYKVCVCVYASVCVCVCVCAVLMFLWFLCSLDSGIPAEDEGFAHQQ